MKIKLFVILVAGLITFACSRSPVDEKQQLTDRIRYLEENLYSHDGRFNFEYANNLISNYLIFTESYPEDQMAADNLFKAADISINLDNQNRTISLLNRIIDDYPNYEKAGLAKFLKAFVYDNQIGDTATARQLYLNFIEEHPQHNFVEEAHAAIRNLGKSPEEIIREFEMLNNQ